MTRPNPSIHSRTDAILPASPHGARTPTHGESADPSFSFKPHPLLQLSLRNPTHHLPQPPPVPPQISAHQAPPKRPIFAPCVPILLIPRFCFLDAAGAGTAPAGNTGEDGATTTVPVSVKLELLRMLYPTVAQLVGMSPLRAAVPQVRDAKLSRHLPRLNLSQARLNSAGCSLLVWSLDGGTPCVQHNTGDVVECCECTGTLAHCSWVPLLSCATVVGPGA